MALKLTVLSEQHASLGSRECIVIGVGGGTIGRAHDNDWVLPDPNRYLSAHHARVKFRDGSYHLFDTSSNGIFINDRPEALGRRGSYVLQDGDLLRPRERLANRPGSPVDFNRLFARAVGAADFVGSPPIIEARTIR